MQGEQATNHKIETIEGIGKVMGDKLRAKGVTDTAGLIGKAAIPKDREVPSLSAVRAWIAAAKDMPRALHY
jgi:hypothetical protein